MRSFVLTLLFILTALSCHAGSRAKEIEHSLKEYIAGKDAKIGVAVVLPDGSLVGVNQHEAFPMMSVVKLPVALAVIKALSDNGMSLSDSIAVSRAELHADTYSPMLKKYSADTSHNIAVGELIDYALRVSDNNACDILMRFAGGPKIIEKYIRQLGIEGIAIEWNEDEMHADMGRCFGNSSTPEAMARLMSKLDHEFKDANPLTIKTIMETCETGADRLAKPLAQSGAIIGHKTGTGPINPQSGRIMAVNDAGYVRFPNGRHYSIAVFISDSSYNTPQTSAMIAEISAIVYDYVR